MRLKEDRLSKQQHRATRRKKEMELIAKGKKPFYPKECMASNPPDAWKSCIQHRDTFICHTDALSLWAPYECYSVLIVTTTMISIDIALIFL